MKRMVRVILVLLAVGLGRPAWAGPVDGPFADAAFVPADVRMYLHVRDAAKLRGELAGRPIGRWLADAMERSAAGDAWNVLAGRSGFDDGELFDRLLGRRFTLLARGGDDTGAQWAMMTTVPTETMQSLRKAWRLQQQLPRHGFAISTLPEQDIMFAVEGELVFIGPRSAPKLFDELLQSHGGNEGPSLAARDGAGASMRALGRDGRVGLYMSHDEVLGGWSALVADLHGDEVKLQHAAEFERPPFRRGVTGARCDFSRLRAFEQDQLLTVMEPTDIGESQMEAYLARVVGEGVTGKAMRDALGERRIIAIGEEEGRLRDVPEDVLAPAAAVCIEVDGDRYTVKQLDHQMTRMATRLNDLQQGQMLIAVPPVRAFEQGHDRHIDISPAAEWFTGGFPIMKTITLNWDVAEGPDGTWAVIAASPNQLETVVQSLKRECATEAKLVGTLDNVGVINGMRLGRQLSNWAGQADALAEQGRGEEFRQVVGALAELAAAVDRVTWQMRRPSRNQMRLDVQVQLGDRPSE